MLSLTFDLETALFVIFNKKIALNAETTGQTVIRFYMAVYRSWLSESNKAAMFYTDH